MKEVEIVPYLPHNVRMVCMYGDGDFNYEGRIKRLTYWNCNRIDGKQWKLILHPLGDLIKPYLLGGQTPIVELAKMAYPMHEDWRIYTDDYEGADLESAISDDGGWFEYVNNSFWRNDDGVLNQLQLFQKLFEWHFDVFGLIEKGEAIDFNTFHK